MCFALSCKCLLQISSLVRIRVPSVVEHMFLPPSTCEDIFILFRRIAPRDDCGKLDKSMGLCCDCLRYRTRRKGFWNSYRRNCLEMEAVSEMWEDRVSSWHVDYSFQCPECWYQETHGTQDRNKATRASMGTKRSTSIQKAQHKKKFNPRMTIAGRSVLQSRPGKSCGPGRQQAGRRSSRLGNQRKRR